VRLTTFITSLAQEGTCHALLQERQTEDSPAIPRFKAEINILVYNLYGPAYRSGNLTPEEIAIVYDS
jgi:hypothetical protein